MKNKLEQKLDVEFKRMNIVLPMIYHFRRRMGSLNAVTIAAYGLSWSDIKVEIIDIGHHYPLDVDVERYSCATYLLQGLRARHIYGVAICDRRDQFNRQRGRIIAKGRLSKHLKEIAK